MVLKNFLLFIRKHVQKSLFNKVACLKACNFTKKRLQHRCFPMNIANFLRSHSLKNSCERLLLNHYWKWTIVMVLPSTNGTLFFLQKIHNTNQLHPLKKKKSKLLLQQQSWYYKQVLKDGETHMWEPICNSSRVYESWEAKLAVLPAMSLITVWSIFKISDPYHN